MIQSTFRAIVLLFMIIGAVLLVASIFGKHWIQTMDDYSGLWEICSTKDQSCKVIDHPWLPWVRAFLVIGTLFLGLCMFYYMCLIHSPKAFNPVCMSILMSCAAISILVALCVYTYCDMDSLTDSYRYHWSFWVAWIGFKAVLIGTIMSIHDARRPLSPFADAHRLK